MTPQGHIRSDRNDFTFIIKLKNQLDIDNANIFVLRDDKSRIKELTIEGEFSNKLVVAYKTIYINTYTINVIDISTIE